MVAQRTQKSIERRGGGKEKGKTEREKERKREKRGWRETEKRKRSKMEEERGKRMKKDGRELLSAKDLPCTRRESRERVL